MKKKTKNYQKELLEDLKNSEEAAEYLNAALEDGSPEVFLLAIRNVVEARGGMKNLATQTELNRENLYRMLSDKGNPGLYSLQSILEVLGLRLAVETVLKKAS